MKVEKKHLLDLERCYAVNDLTLHGKDWILAATEGHGSCCAFDAEDLTTMQTVWNEPGGTMSFAKIPGAENEFLAIQKFFKLFQWEEAQLVWVTSEKPGEFSVKPVLAEPYIHRFDVFETDAGCFFVGCSLAAHKDTREDWTRAGKVLVGRVDKELRTIEDIRVFHDDLFQNHGYWRWEREEGACGLIGCREGIFRLTPPTNASDWGWTQMADFPVSDMAMVDLDGDGQLELATIEPFHGEYFRIYRKCGDGWERIYEHPEVTEFYHAVWGGTLCGKAAILSGCRRGKKQLSLITMEQGEICTTILDEDMGPSNVHVIHQEGRDLIVSANREAARLDVYILMED